jgi:hypothetical protein
MPMRDLKWYFNRLRVMQPQEVLHRLFEQANIHLLHIKYLLGILDKKYKSLECSDHEFCASDKSQLPSLQFHYNPTDEPENETLKGRGSALGYEWYWSDTDSIWHLSPDTDNIWPQLFFSKINYRAGNPYGDIRVAWEPARLQHLIELSLIALKVPSKREQAISLLTDELESWVKINPPGRGIHYVSAMECALRLIAVCYALNTARPYLGKSSSVWQNLLTIIYSHADLAHQRLSLHSSSGNHTIAECVGLIYAGLLFPKIPGAKGWLNTGLTLLREESKRQILPDGGGIERAPWYHLFIIDLIGLADEVLKFKKLSVPTEIKTALERGRKFINILANSPSSLPRQGDADDGYALSPYLHLGWNPDIKRDLIETFPDYGITCTTFSRDGLSRLLLDHGPLGMAPSFGHGHADALSFTVEIDGQELLVDTGTYSYTGKPEWRDYFRSTRAHNTICVDDTDQAKQVSAFQWTNPFNAELIRSHTSDNGAVFIHSRHNGYSHLGIEHIRYIIVLPEEHIIVLDRILGSGKHKLDLHWHLATAPDVVGKTLHINNQQRIIKMHFQNSNFTLHSGEIDPICGWRSRYYGIREEITTVKLNHTGELPHEFITTIDLSDKIIHKEELKSYIEKVKQWDF